MLGCGICRVHSMRVALRRCWHMEREVYLEMCMKMSVPSRIGVQILDAVRKGKNSFSKKDLHQETGISWGTMCKTVDALLADGFIFARRESPSGRGRPMIPLCVNQESAYFMGIDVGASQTKILVLDLGFNSLSQESVPTPAYRDESSFFDWLGNVFEEATEKAGIQKGKLLGVGLSVSGNVDSDSGLIVSGSNFGMQWGSNLSVQVLSRRLGVAAYAMTTQVAAACAEYHFGRNAGCGNLVTIGLGVGIGSGVVSNHQLLLSYPGRPVGYIGHILMPDNFRPCVCGFKGCLESYSGGGSLAAVARERMTDRPEACSAEALDRLAASGDALAGEILLKAASYNAVGIATMIQLYSPEAIVFSGGQCRKDGFLYTETISALTRILPDERRINFSMAITNLGSCQSALGAARLAYENFF